MRIFSLGSLLIEPARLTILTKSSSLIANQLSIYTYFCQNQLILHLFRPKLLFSFAITSVSKVKKHNYCSWTLKNYSPCSLNWFSKNMLHCSLHMNRSSNRNLRVYTYYFYLPWYHFLSSHHLLCFFTWMPYWDEI